MVAHRPQIPTCVWVREAIVRARNDVAPATSGPVHHRPGHVKLRVFDPSARTFIHDLRPSKTETFVTIVTGASDEVLQDNIVRKPLDIEVQAPVCVMAVTVSPVSIDAGAEDPGLD